MTRQPGECMSFELTLMAVAIGFACACLCFGISVQSC